MKRLVNFIILFVLCLSLDSCNNNEKLINEIKTLNFEEQNKFSRIFDNDFDYYFFEYKQKDVIVKKENDEFYVSIFSSKNNKSLNYKDLDLYVTCYDIVDKYGVPNHYEYGGNYNGTMIYLTNTYIVKLDFMTFEKGSIPRLKNILIKNL